jgi:hypothetical protein
MRLLALILIAVCFVGCVQRQPQSVRDAVGSLKKVQAASEIGTTYEQFSGLVIDARVKTNNALKDLPEGELRDTLSEAIGCYSDAATVWLMKVRRQPLYLYGDARSILMKYSIQVEQGNVEASADHDAALTEILKRGNAQVRLAINLVEPSQK